MREKFVITALNTIAGNKKGRKLLAKNLDKYIYSGLVENETEDLRAVQEKKYQYLSAMLQMLVKNIDKGYISRELTQKLVKVAVKNVFLDVNKRPSSDTNKRFKEKYGIFPPLFIALSPTQRCNLKCTGCYAAASPDTGPTLSYSVVDRIIEEVHEAFGGRFIVISGGEPFLYKSDGKNLLDIFEKYNDMFFLIYTNGTMITPAVAERLAKLGNATPAVSVEGFEEETRQRRGRGVWEKVLQALENMRNAGVAFGISVTSTSENTDLLLEDRFYDYFFEDQGATYMWQFQFMPIGYGSDRLDLMVPPQKRLELYRIWEKQLIEKKYCLADFWNGGMLSSGCIAYGREDGGYLYIDWNGNIMPCVFVPYYVDNIVDLFKNGKCLSDALMSDFMKNGREWQKEYGLADRKKAHNWLMPCGIRDHHEIFRKSILPENVLCEDENAEAALKSDEYFESLKHYDEAIKDLTEEIWEKEYRNKNY